MTHLNIEIKAHCSDLEKIRELLASKQAEFKGIDHQIDTYFQCINGRLKLREGNIEHTLIHYNRPNTKTPKASMVTMEHLQSSTNIKAVLTEALGIKVVVDKQRGIYFIENVKFHVDEVKHLGSFVEIEAIDLTGDIGQEKLQEQCKYYMQLFGIDEKDLVHCSYSDLLLNDQIA